MRYQAVFFDFDGVILDSVQVKTRTFAAMFRKYGPEVEKAVENFHLANGGVSRFIKFEHYYKNILKKPVTKEELKALGDEFSRIALQGVLDSPYIPGAMKTLRDLKARNILCFVASGTPDEEIKFIVREKGLSTYFIEVHGSPKKKDEIIFDILDRYGLTSGKCLFIGDAMTDHEAAYTCGMQFLGIISDGSDSPFPPRTRISSHVSVI